MEAPTDIPPSTVNPEPPRCLLASETTTATFEDKATNESSATEAEETSPGSGRSAKQVCSPRWIRTHLEEVFQQHQFRTLMDPSQTLMITY